MKPFKFRLERVLSWRGTQLSLAEAKLEQINGALRKTDVAIAEVVKQEAAALATIGRPGLVSGSDLGALGRSHVWGVREEKRLAAHKLELQRSLVAQNRAVSNARREVKLVERLKERQYVSWKSEADHELVELAGESAIAQWRRLNR